MEAEYRDRKPWFWELYKGGGNKGRSTAQSREHWRPDRIPGTADKVSGPTRARCGQSGCGWGLSPSGRHYDVEAGSIDSENDCECCS